MNALQFTIPLRTVSALNAREHFRVRANRVKAEREATRAALPSRHVALGIPNGTLLVTLTRVGPRKLDRGDNLGASMKAVRDELAAWLGVNDGNEEQAHWAYEMERGPFAVKVRVEPLPPACVTCGAHRLPIFAPEPATAAEMAAEARALRPAVRAMGAVAEEHLELEVAQPNPQRVIRRRK